MTCVERLSPADLRSALAILLTPLGGRRGLGQRHIAGFYEYLEHCPVRWVGWRAGTASTPRGLLLSVLLPGRTAIFLLPEPGQLGIDAEEQWQVTVAGLAELAGHRLHYGQALLEPEAEGKHKLLQRAGFTPLAPLIYLERDVLHPWVDPSPPGLVQWLTYGAETRAEFAAAVSATYRDSLDCPELTGLRPIDDVLAAHQASGRFDPALWELARVDGQPAACLLLSRHTHGEMVELVYMGVVPDHRRRGLGSRLLRRTLEQCRAVGARQLTVVVDERNEPARHLYARFGLQAVARRDAYLYRWPARAPGHIDVAGGP